MLQEPLVSISEASRILGVSEAALRQWTDEGKIKAFVTPGGHRRYYPADLKKLMHSHVRMLGMRDLAVSLEDSAELLRETSRSYFKDAHWYGHLSPEQQSHLARLGRQLLSLIIRYLAEPSRRPLIVDMTRDVGRDLGATLAELGLSLTESVEAFVAHRSPIMDTAVQVMKKKQASTSRMAEAIPLVTRVTDEALVSLVEAHQSRQGQDKGGNSG
ncbi:MAG: MerR family transcriptional regulator [Chloroflexi bacterium]|nr:MerR family transcriptional regulator [Chloroflexota bacterium]